VVGFGSSSRLASAYGVAVMGTMLTTTVLTFFVVRHGWGYPLAVVVASTGFFLALDLAFFASAMHKVFEGGWLPLALGALVFGLMMTWRRGRVDLAKRLQAGVVPLRAFLESLLAHPPQRVPGTAVFLTASAEATPHALLHSLKHYKVLHEQNVFLTVEFRDVPWIPIGQRVACDRIASGCWAVVVHYGFMDRPDTSHALELCGPMGLQVDPMEVSYFLSRQKVVPVRSTSAVARMKDGLFAFLARNAATAGDFFNIPANRVVELGSRVEL
jgi:KUP system potassium uptake protein